MRTLPGPDPGRRRGAPAGSTADRGYGPPYEGSYEQRFRDFVRQAHSPAHAVQLAAEFFGIGGAGRQISDWQARMIAEAACGFAEQVVETTKTAPREPHWEDPRFREHLRREMRWDLLDMVTRTGRVPVSLPAEQVRYLRGFGLTAPPGSGAGTGGMEETGEDGPWDTVAVTLTVGVRVPPVDREAAVRAGLLHGPPPG